MPGHEPRAHGGRQGRDPAGLAAIAHPAPDLPVHGLDERLEDRDAGGEDGRLGDRRVIETLGRPLEADLCELVAERAAGLLEGLAGVRRRLVDRAAHADYLRALPGKDERQIAHARSHDTAEGTHRRASWP